VFLVLLLNKQPSDRATRLVGGRHCGLLGWLARLAFLLRWFWRETGPHSKIPTLYDVFDMKLLSMDALHFSQVLIAPRWPVLLSKIT
jgi:hypothetical protein